MHALLVNYLLSQAPLLETLKIETFTLPTLPHMPSLTNLTIQLDSQSLCDVAHCLPLLITLKCVSLMATDFKQEGRARPDLLLAGLPNLGKLHLADIVPGQLELRNGFRGLEINIRSFAEADYAVWREVAPTIRSLDLMVLRCELPEMSSLPGILLEPLSLHSLGIFVVSLGTETAPVRLPGAVLQAKHVIMSAYNETHVIIPSSGLAWERVFIRSQNLLDLTFVDLPAFVGSPIKFCFQYNNLHGLSLLSLGHLIGKGGFLWHAETSKWKACTVMNFQKPRKWTDPKTELFFDCHCRSCKVSLEFLGLSED